MAVRVPYANIWRLRAARAYHAAVGDAGRAVHGLAYSLALTGPRRGVRR